MTDTTLPPPGDDAPIDAEFEPAQKRKPDPKKHRGPGWLSFLLLGGVSLFALVLSAVSTGIVPGLNDDAKTEAAIADIELLKVDMETTRDKHVGLQTEIAVISATADVTEDRLDRLNDAVTDVSGALERLEADLLALDDASQVEVVTDGETISLAPLLARIEGLESIISDFSTGVASAEADLSEPQINLPDLEVKLTALRTDIDTLRDELTTLRGDLSSLLDAQDTAAQAEINVATTRSAAVALSAIEAAARRGQPFQTAYRNLSEAAPDTPGTNALAPIAAIGAPTLQDLRERFRPLKREALKVDAARKGGAASVLQSLFGDGVKVRREGDTDTSADLNTAETALVTGDLESALHALSALSPDVQAVFTDWRQDAQDRLTLEDALDTLRLAMIAKDRP